MMMIRRTNSDAGANAVNGPRWTMAYDQLSAADRASPLDPADLDRLAMAAYLTGRDAESADALTRAHNAYLAGGDVPRAARSAFWLGFVLSHNGENARAAGWIARASRLLEEGGHDCVERGYLLIPAGLQHLSRRDLQAARDTFGEALRIGERFGDVDLVTLARMAHGRTLIGLGEIARGIALLDEAMVSVTAGGVSPLVAGTVYCSVVSACVEMFDLRRAQEWTEALDRWCASQPDVLPYRGECLAHRAEIMVLHGAWSDAAEEARRACRCLTQPSARTALGTAFYQLGEVHRVRGEFGEAEDAYRRTAESGRTPHPGLALLRLAQGRRDDAVAAISRVMEEARDPRMRSRVLPASVEILLAGGDTAAGRRAADELRGIATAIDTPLLRALSAHADGAVLLAEREARRALVSLRDACTLWRTLDAPYEAARTTVLIGLACRELGDGDGARMELGAALRVFRELGATPDAAGAERLIQSTGGAAGGPLTTRELQVLRLVAAGSTNRAIADTLAISEKTVARHVSNIFTKLDLPSRAAATAYAFTHGLVQTTRPSTRT